MPVYPVQSYSITLHLADRRREQVAGVGNNRQRHKIDIIRLGDCIHVGIITVIAGCNSDLPPPCKATMQFLVEDLVNGGVEPSRAIFWIGLCSMTPNDTSVIGGAKFDNFHLNTDYGTLGWTMICGLNRVLDDMIGGVRPEIDVAYLAQPRYA